MKKILIYILPVLIVSASACIKSNPAVKVARPSGTFRGEFRLLHKKKNQLRFDTLKANVQLVLSGDVNYVLTGDTATVHAGSKGTYEVGAGGNTSLIGFTDSTYPKSGTPLKTHLTGAYLYYYDGTKFQMVANSMDTLSLQYDLKRAN